MNPGTLVIINLLGGIALLLWGVRMVRTGVMRAWGDRLKRFIERRLSNRLSAFAAGAVATGIIGSGTAMTLIVAGIAASGAISTQLGLAVLLGADVGSAIVSAVFASGSAFALWASPILIFAGYIVFSRGEEFRPRGIGRILIGVGLMLLSLRLISTATAPLREASLFHDVLAAVGREPVLAFITAAILAFALHSTLAVILLIALFLANGSLALAGALGFILGTNFGGGLPALMATLAMPPAARRLPLANLICRGVAALLALAFIDRLVPLIARLPFGPVESAVAFHAAFNIAAGLAYLPIIATIARLASKLAPDDADEADHLAAPRYLDPIALKTPGVALTNALNETVRMSELLDRMFNTSLKALRTGSLETLKLLKGLDEKLNAYQSSVQSYLAELSGAPLSAEEAQRALEITLYVSNLEHGGDIIQLSLADRIKAKAKEGITFTPDEQASLDDLCLIVHDNLRLAVGVLGSRDVEGAKQLIAQKDAFRALENKVLDAHFKGGARGRGQNLRRSALYVDLIRDLHRVNSHVVSAGYPIVEAAGLLRESRIRKTPKPA